VLTSVAIVSTIQRFDRHPPHDEIPVAECHREVDAAEERNAGERARDGEQHVRGPDGHVIRDESRGKIRGAEECRHGAKDEALRIAEHEPEQDRRADGSNCPPGEVRKGGEEAERGADDQHHAVELHARTAAADERKEEHQSRGEIE
jgi:hypothetical protein